MRVTWHDCTFTHLPSLGPMKYRELLNIVDQELFSSWLTVIKRIPLESFSLWSDHEKLNKLIEFIRAYRPLP